MIAISSAMLGLLPCKAAGEQGSYTLGVGDHLRVKVIEWRPARGDSYEWPGLSGEFVVDGAGYLSLPLIGRVSVSGKDLAQVGDLISSALQTRTGLVQKPETAVEISQYRPLFVTGSVEKPGSYSYQPGLTVLEAVSLAGGFYRSPVIDRARQGVEARGSYRVLRIDRFHELANIARLEAEATGAPSIAFPAELVKPDSTAAREKILNDARRLFETRRDTLRSQSTSFDQTKALLGKEIEALQARIDSQQHQKALAEEELANVSSLVAKGLVVLPRKLALEQSAAQFESTILELRVSIVRAQQDVERASREQTELQRTIQNQSLVDLAAARQRLSEDEAKMATAQELDEGAVSGNIAGPDGAEVAPTYRFEILRPGPSELVTLAASEADPVRPGDMIKVSLSRIFDAQDDNQRRAEGQAGRVAQRDMSADPLLKTR